MNEATQQHYTKLTESLSGLIRVYRSLVQVVRKEREILVAANLDDLSENNRSKEAMLLKARELERRRAHIINELVAAEKIKDENISLLELAIHFEGEKGDKLRHFHSVLELLVKRMQEFNRENEVLVKSALDNITGAMRSLKENIMGQATYQPKGKTAVEVPKASSGRLMSKEA